MESIEFVREGSSTFAVIDHDKGRSIFKIRQSPDVGLVLIPIDLASSESLKDLLKDVT